MEKRSSQASSFSGRTEALFTMAKLVSSSAACLAKNLPWGGVHVDPHLALEPALSGDRAEQGQQLCDRGR
eukprot:3080608-Alexandrium_andersonii.AAC.1